jgi:hypothetical protein
MSLIISALAIISILFGMVSMVTPIPGGTILIAGGVTALICSSPSAQYCVMWIRSRVNWFNKVLFWLQSKVGNKIKVLGIALSKTIPPEDVDPNLTHSDFVKERIDNNNKIHD